jgi:two-component system sensor histidine kinase AlgZ
MHPILAHRRRLGFYLLAWLPVAAVLTALLARPGAMPAGPAAALAVPLTLLYAFLGLAAWYPARGMPLERGRAAAIAATHGAGALLTSAVWVAAGAGLARLLAAASGWNDLPALYARELLALFAAGVLLYLLCVALQYLFLSFEAVREAERREAELTTLAREAELAALKARVQPHFLFNSLNAIAALVSRDPPQAREMCVALSDFLRSSLAVGERSNVTLAEEMDLARRYLDVERVRFGDRLRVDEDLDPDAEDCRVPPLLLQPLVENAVVHGISTLMAGGVIRLETARSARRLRILVENPYDPQSPARPRGGMGEKLVRDRLAAVYGREALFASRSVDGRHLAVLSIPVGEAM